MRTYKTSNIESIKSFSFDKEIENILIENIPNYRLKTSDIMRFVIPLLPFSFEEKLKIFNKENTNNVSRQFKEIYQYFSKDFDDLFKKIGIDKNDPKCFRKLVLFLNNKLYKCKHCGKITEREYCSRVCANSNHSEKSIKLQRENSIKTMFERYNGYYSSTEEFREKIKSHYNINYPNGHKPECFKNFENLNCEFVLNNFVDNNKFLINEMKNYFNCSYSFINKFKVKNDIKIENKRDFSKSKIQ